MGTLNCKNCNCRNHNNNNDNERSDADGNGDDAKCNEIGEMSFPLHQCNKANNQCQWEITTKSNNQMDSHCNEKTQMKEEVNIFKNNYGGRNIQSISNNMDSHVTDVNDNGECNKVGCSRHHVNRKDMYSNQSDVFLGMEVNDDDNNYNYNFGNKDINNHLNINSGGSNNINSNSNNGLLSQKQNEIKTEREDELCYSNINLDNNININSNCDDIVSGTTSNMNIYPPHTECITTSNNNNNNNNNTNSLNDLLTPSSETKNNIQLTLQENKIQFGIDRNDLSLEERKLMDEAQNNLNQFYPPEKKEENLLQKKLSKIELISFIPQSKLETLTNTNEVFFHGELKKLVNYEISAYKPQLYSSRFCTLTNISFYYYKSKETYLRKQKPLCVVPLTQITKVSFAKIKKTSKKIDHLIICNKLGIIKNNKKEMERCKLFQDLDINSCMTSSSESGESLIVFTSEIEETLFKWFIVLNYLLNKIKEQSNNV